jgi:hypothetical protein
MARLYNRVRTIEHCAMLHAGRPKLASTYLDGERWNRLPARSRARPAIYMI